MACDDMDHLVFLTSGDAALTRRARAASGLSAIVVRFSGQASATSGKRRILTCSSEWRRRSCICFLAARACARDRPPHRATRKRARRRSVAGRALQSDAIELAVLASVRHRDTRYDELLMSGSTARARARTPATRSRARSAHGAPPRPPRTPPDGTGTRYRALLWLTSRRSRRQMLRHETSLRGDGGPVVWRVLVRGGWFVGNCLGLLTHWTKAVMSGDVS